MSATIKASYGTATAITITLANLADAAAREGTAVDNSTNLYLDAMLHVAVTLAAGSPSGDKAVNVYLYASHDGTDYTDNATGTDAAVTMRSPTNFTLLGYINCPDSGGLTYKGIFTSVAAAFFGLLPKKWGIVIENKTGVALSASGHVAEYVGVYAQQVLP